VRQIKVTYVGFRAHVKIASRIVSYRCVTRLTCCRSVQFSSFDATKTFKTQKENSQRNITKFTRHSYRLRRRRLDGNSRPGCDTLACRSISPEAGSMPRSRSRRSTCSNSLASVAAPPSCTQHSEGTAIYTGKATRTSK